MGYRLREIDPESKFSRTLSVDAFEQVFPLELLRAVLEAEHAQTRCERKLNLPMTMLVTIALHRYPHPAIDDIRCKLAQRSSSDRGCTSVCCAIWRASSCRSGNRGATRAGSSARCQT